MHNNNGWLLYFSCIVFAWPVFSTRPILLYQKVEICPSKNFKFEKFWGQFFKRLGTLVIFVFSSIMAYFFDGIIDYYCTSFVLLSLRRKISVVYIYLYNSTVVIAIICPTVCMWILFSMQWETFSQKIFLTKKKSSNPIQSDDKIKGRIFLNFLIWSKMWHSRVFIKIVKPELGLVRTEEKRFQIPQCENSRIFLSLNFLREINFGKLATSKWSIWHFT